VSIFVEILIRAPFEAVWSHTQRPELHERWDLRFTSIEYLPRSSEREPQRFRYSTRIGFGLGISGDGASVAKRALPDGGHASSLCFGSASPISLIREGSGYWKYEPRPDGVRFLTSYDYRTRFGRLGSLIDRMVFRPLLGWATAWSFDRLRRWLEDGVAPAVSTRIALVHVIARLGMAATFAYHGIVPKLIGHDRDEVALLVASGVPREAVDSALVVLGFAELALAIALLVFANRRWPTLVCIGIAVAATIVVLATAPRYLGSAFNPVTLNLGLACLAAVDLIALVDAPSARRCRRRPTETAS
jgi:DoxX-like protein